MGACEVPAREPAPPTHTHTHTHTHRAPPYLDIRAIARGLALHVWRQEGAADHPYVAVRPAARQRLRAPKGEPRADGGKSGPRRPICRADGESRRGPSRTRVDCARIVDSRIYRLLLHFLWPAIASRGDSRAVGALAPLVIVTSLQFPHVDHSSGSLRER